MTQPTLITIFFLVPLLVGALLRWTGPRKELINTLLSFSGAYLLAIAVLHVLPELYATGGMQIGRWLLAGFVLQVVLEFFSKGIEHGHAHLPPSGVFPTIVLISLCLHSMLEGVPFAGIDQAVDHAGHNHAGHDHGHDLVGLPLMIAVLLHKIPVAVALGSVMLGGKSKASQYWLYLLLFAISFPLGVFAGGVIAPVLGGVSNLLGLAMGMLLHISMTIIFESSKEHKINPKRFVSMLAGMGIAWLSLVWMA